jgi:cysteine desulfurase
MSNRIYFDNAATTAIDENVFAAMMPYFTEKFGNPSSIYSYGRETKLAIETARKTVAKILNAHPSEIFFTSGGSESNNTAILAAIRDLGCTRIISSVIEHHAVSHTVEHFERLGSIRAEYVRILDNGHVDLEHLETLLASSTEKTLVSLMHANNEIGNLLDIEAVANLCQKHQAYFHSDTVQTVGHYPIDLNKIPVHFITGAAHKFHGPKGVGLLYINRNVQIKPFIFGGGQERNMRAGTENIYGIVGFAKALELADANHDQDKLHVFGIKHYMYQQLIDLIPGVGFNGDVMGDSLYTVLSTNFLQSEKTDMLLMNLDLHHVCASSGSACSSGAEAGSHVIRALNTNTNQLTIRFSFSKFNTKSEVDLVVKTLIDLI